MLDAAKIKQLRKKRGLTQEQAAIAAGMTSRQQWNNLESGRKLPRLETLAKMASVLGVRAKDLLE